MLRAVAILAALTVCLPTHASDKKIIWPKEFASNKPYSPGVLVDGTLYVSGQLGRDLKTGKIPADFDAEVRQCFRNLSFVLRDARMSWDDVVSVQVYLTSLDNYERLNTIYGSYFKQGVPARTTVGVSSLLASARIEISIVARSERSGFMPMPK